MESEARVTRFLFCAEFAAGIEEAGLHEVIHSVLRRLSSDQSTSVAKGGVLLCGGGAKFPNLLARFVCQKKMVKALDYPFI